MLYIGCDMALKHSSICYRDTVNNRCDIMLMTHRKKLLKLEEYHNFDHSFNVYFHDSNLPFNQRLDCVLSPFKEIKYKNNTIVNIEGYSYGSLSASIYQIGEYIGIFKYLLGKEGFNYTIVAPTQLKKFASGIGTAKKKQMFESIKNKTIKEDILSMSKTLKIGVDKDGISDIVDSYHLSLYKA